MDSATQSFPRRSRLLTKEDYSRVFAHNQKKASSRNALLLALKSPTGPSRVGLVVAKKNVKLATQRNRIKRLVREHFRCNPPRQHWDLVLLARKGMGDLTNEQIRQQLVQLWSKLNDGDTPR